MSIARPIDPLPPRDQWCGARRTRFGWLCTLPPGHILCHEARLGGVVLDAWHDEETYREVDA